MPADNKGANPIHEKKDDPDLEKGDKGHAAAGKAEGNADHTPGQKGVPGRDEPHRRRTGGNPDASN